MYNIYELSNPKIANLIFGVSLAALSTTSIGADFRVMLDGSSAVVLKKVGTTTTYVKEARRSEDGKVTLLNGEVFAGRSLVKLPNGRCQLIVERLSDMKSVSVGDMKIETPEVAIEVQPSSCGLDG